MLLLFLVTLTGSLPFLSSSSKDSNVISEKVVSLKRPLLPPLPDHHANPLPKPDAHEAKPDVGEHRNSENDANNAEQDEHEKKLFNFDPEDTKEISYERDLQHAEHNERQKWVVEAARHSWSAYHEYAWGADHLRPLTKTKQNWFNIGLTILDSLDTLMILGMDRELADALEWVENTLSFDIYKDVSLAALIQMCCH